MKEQYGFMDESDGDILRDRGLIGQSSSKKKIRSLLARTGRPRGKTLKEWREDGKIVREEINNIVQERDPPPSIDPSPSPDPRPPSSPPSSLDN